MTALAWPALSRTSPKSVQMSLVANTQVFISPLSGAIQTTELPGARWRMTFTLDNLTEDDSAKLQAFLVRLRGLAGRFTLHNFARPSPRGVATGTPLVKGAGQVGGQLITDGWTPNVAGILKAGDFIGVNGELKMVVVDANSNGSGTATLLVEPPLRSSPSDNAVVTTRKPTTVFRLTENVMAWSTAAPVFTDVSFAIEEVI